jgi:uncharacterized ferredoxin-like protein
MSGSLYVIRNEKCSGQSSLTAVLVNDKCSGQSSLSCRACRLKNAADKVAFNAELVE